MTVQTVKAGLYTNPKNNPEPNPNNNHLSRESRDLSKPQTQDALTNDHLSEPQRMC